MRMRNVRNLVTSIACWLVLGLSPLGLRPAFAEGGVTFTNISAKGGAGITYQRHGTPSRVAVADAIYAQSPIPLTGQTANAFTIKTLPNTPQKPRGAPGVAVFDYDNDGDLDIYVTNGPGFPNSLYRNMFKETGKLTFVDVAEQAGVTATSQDSSGVCFGDLDNDGFEDLYVTGIGEPNILFHNNGNGTFTDITESSGMGAGNFHHAGCAMGDFNGDGLLDVTIANTYDDWNHRKTVFVNELYPGVEPNQLFMRTPGKNIQFTDESTTSGIRNLVGLPGGASFTWSVAAVDINQDGFTDIMFSDIQGPLPTKPSEDRGYPRVFLNDGTGHFTDVTVKSKLDKVGSWMGLAFGDFNCDGNLDFFATNLGNWIGGPQSSRWFLGKSDGTFDDPGVGALRATPFGWGDVAIDYDNDGDQDIIYYGDDELLNAIAMDNPGSVLRNRGCSARFVQETKVLTYDHRFREVNGVAKGDLNNDGFEDIVTVANFQIVPQTAWFVPFTVAGTKLNSALDGIAAFEALLSGRLNPGFYTYIPHDLPNGDLAIEINSANNGNGWAAVKLVGNVGRIAGAKSNRDGIGAIVKFTPAEGKTVISPVLGGASHASQSSLTANFGLGTASDGTVDVLWPGGTRNRLYNLRSQERIRFPEIPCSYAGTYKNSQQYDACVRNALNLLVEQKTITKAERQRFFKSASQAYRDFNAGKEEQSTEEGAR